MVLAISSPPTRILENNCAGIERPETYQHIVKVREVTEGHLALVFVDDQGDYGSLIMPEDGRLYGCLDPSSRAENITSERHSKTD